MSDFTNVAIILPAKNESKTVKKVVSDFKRALPGAVVVVCDNNSDDDTSILASEAGALVTFEQNAGKANAVSRLFWEVDAEIYLMVDCDDTYDSSTAARLIEQFRHQNLDLLIVSRLPTDDGDAFPSMHRLGNWFFTTLFALLFNSRVSDVLSGYRMLSKRFVKAFPIMSRGFEIEIEMTAVACACNFTLGTASTEYRARPSGSASKLHTFKDGFRILVKSLVLLVDYRPLLTFGSLGTASLVLSAFLFEPVFSDYLHTGLVERLPTAILCLGLVLLSSIFFVLGLILNGISRLRIEAIKASALRVSLSDYSQR